MPEDRNALLDSLLADLVERRLDGKPVDLNDVAAKYPELADDLYRRWSDLELLDAAWARHAVDTTTAPEPSSVRRLADVSMCGFQLLREIGRGGMGVVYLALQQDLEREVALKVLPGIANLSDHSRERFIREAKAVASVVHPNIVQVHSMGEDMGQLFIAMEYVPGISLAEVLSAVRTASRNENGSLVWDQALKNERNAHAADGTEMRIDRRATNLPEQTGSHGVPNLDADYIRRCCETVATVARGLHAAHERGIVHRDVKPSNILIGRDGGPKLADFGLATVSWEPHITMSGEFCGTPHYVSPEQARGKHRQLDRRADVYSLGVTLYECLTLVTPFDGESPHEILAKVMHASPRRPRQVNGALARDLETIVERCLEKDPGLRYGTAAELADDLDNFLAYRPIRARRVGPIARSLKLVHRRPLPIALAIVSLAAAALLVLSIRFWSNERTRMADQSFRAMVDRADMLAYAISMPWLDEQIPEEMDRRKHDAESIYSEALISRPDDFWCRLQRARLRFARGAPKAETTEDVRAALRAIPTSKAPAIFEQLIEHRLAGTWKWDKSRWSEWREDSLAARQEGATADDSYFLAVVACLENDRKSARHHLSRVLQRQPDHYWALVGRCDVGNGDVTVEQSLEEARRDARAAMALRPAYLASYYVTVHAYLGDRDYSAETRSMLENALQEHPDDQVLLSSMVSLLDWTLRDYDSCETWARRAIAAHDSAENRSALANVLQKLGRFEDALEQVERGIILAGKHRYATYLHTSKANILARLDRTDEAIAACNDALRIDPSDGYARSVLAQLYVQRNSVDTAIDQLRQLRISNEQYFLEHGEYWNLSQNLEALGRTDEAEQELANGISLADSRKISVFVPHRMFLAALRTRLHGPGAGDSVFADKLNEHANEPNFLLEYANYLDSQGRIDEAIIIVRRAMSCYDTRRDGAIARSSLAALLERKGLLEESLREFEIALTDHPSTPYYYKDVSRVLRKLGLTSRAIAVAQSGLDASGESVELLQALGAAQRDAGQNEAAADVFARAVKLAVSRPDAHHSFDPQLLDDFVTTLRTYEAGSPTDELLKQIRANLDLPAPFRFRAALRRAELLLDIGQLEEAEAAAQEAAQIREKRAWNWEGFFLLGRIQLKRGKGAGCNTLGSNCI